MRPQMLTKIHSHKFKNQSDIIFRTTQKKTDKEKNDIHQSDRASPVLCAVETTTNPADVLSGVITILNYIAYTETKNVIIHT